VPTWVQILDLYQAGGYRVEVAQVACPRRVPKRTQWLEARGHELKPTKGAAALLLEEMQELARHPLSESLQERLQRALPYFLSLRPKGSRPLTVSHILPSAQG
jgi:hypothetical protein